MYEHDNDTSNIPAEPVDGFWDMNPETDTLLINGDHLYEGMVVLIDDGALGRETTAPDENDPYRMRRWKTTNFWCKIVELDFSRREPTLTFIGLYADGTKRSRTYGRSWCWYVKKDTIPEVAVEQRYRKISFPSDTEPLADWERDFLEAPVEDAPGVGAGIEQPMDDGREVLVEGIDPLICSSPDDSTESVDV